MSFEEGWEEFVNHHGLKLGEILIFKHNGKRAFNVVAYEALGSEKRYDSKGKSPSEATASSTSRTSFVCTMKKSHGDPHKAYLTIPARFARSNGIVATSRIILKDPSGRSWPLILSRWESISRGSHRIAIRTNGWYKVYEANKLKNGDVCTFNLKPVSSKSGSKSARVMDVQITCG
ncbi:B3 domain-containing protein REM14-like isoform X1 [Prunus dulcis]|nr:B3 domain-containing protein REM14-like isoform X1 [Prunus dulcis]XP_034199605.1 B3 domain-containing protein REM14-like isoform X1 [Prunus dulcis]